MEIDIKWSCRNPKEGYSPIVWAQDSTTIPFIPSVVNPPKHLKHQRSQLYKIKCQCLQVVQLQFTWIIYKWELRN